MMTKTGKRTARLQVQIVENPNNITLVFDGHDLPPIIFSAKTGHTGKKAHGKLKKILDDVAAEGQQKKTATKAATTAVAEAVKTVSKEAVKVVSERTGKTNGK